MPSTTEPAKEREGKGVAGFSLISASLCLCVCLSICLTTKSVRVTGT